MTVKVGNHLEMGFIACCWLRTYFNTHVTLLAPLTNTHVSIENNKLDSPNKIDRNKE
jgi:hypothetical protein